MWPLVEDRYCFEALARLEGQVGMERVFFFLNIYLCMCIFYVIYRERYYMYICCMYMCVWYNLRVDCVMLIRRDAAGGLGF